MGDAIIPRSRPELFPGYVLDLATRRMYTQHRSCLDPWNREWQWMLVSYLGKYSTETEAVWHLIVQIELAILNSCFKREQLSTHGYYSIGISQSPKSTITSLQRNELRTPSKIWQPQSHENLIPGANYSPRTQLPWNSTMISHSQRSSICLMKSENDNPGRDQSYNLSWELIF